MPPPYIRYDANSDATVIGPNLQTDGSLSVANRFTVGPGGGPARAFNVIYDEFTTAGISILADTNAGISANGIAEDISLFISSKGSGALQLLAGSGGIVATASLAVRAETSIVLAAEYSDTLVPILEVRTDAGANTDTGLQVIGRPAGSGVQLVAVSGANANESLYIDAKGNGTTSLGSAPGAGNVALGVSMSVPRSIATSAAVNDEALVRTAASTTIGKKFLSGGIGAADDNSGFAATGMTLGLASANWSFTRVGPAVIFKFAVKVTPTALATSMVLTINTAALAVVSTQPPLPVDANGRGFCTIAAEGAAPGQTGTVATTIDPDRIVATIVCSAAAATATTMFGEAWYTA